MAGGTAFVPVRASLRDLLGGEYVEAVVAARAALTGEPRDRLRKRAQQKLDFFPTSFQRALARGLPKVGRAVSAGVRAAARGASTRAFVAAAKTALSPLTGWGYYRVGEAGRVHFLSKSEHYHAPLGHGFPGYRLVEIARRLGVGNATHNNARGAITRRLEEELVRTVNGIAPADQAGLDKLLRSRAPGALNRVLNLQTGSLACEAGIKMMLARFYKVQDGAPPPPYAGRAPVFIVIGDDEGGLRGNYHGTTLVAQAMRGMWPGVRAALAKHGLMKIIPVRPNDVDELEAVFRTYDRGRHKIAGFVHEIVLMNYGGRRLSERFLKRAYALCRRQDVPTMADEIQSCLWSPELYMFREYGLAPTFVVVGKGLPGGECAGSRIIFRAGMDCLPQFGALVTNGQEELTALTYLVTMRWAEANAEVTRAVGDAYEAGLDALAARHPRLVSAIQGRRHMAAICFHRLDKAKAFVKHLVDGGLDISVQTYKTACPPAALTKLPLIGGSEAVEMVLARMDRALRQL